MAIRMAMAVGFATACGLRSSGCHDGLTVCVIVMAIRMAVGFATACGLRSSPGGRAPALIGAAYMYFELMT